MSTTVVHLFKMLANYIIERRLTFSSKGRKGISKKKDDGNKCSNL